jgi:chloramphenicol O-acetyltransferase type A
MREIDTNSWSRKDQYERFRQYSDPYFSLCANVDLTKFQPAAARYKASFTAALIYVLARSANSIPEFRYRLRAESVIEHEIVHPSFTVLLDNNSFSFCSAEYTESFSVFSQRVSAGIEMVKQEPTVTDIMGDEQLYMTAIPWVSFTSFKHPMDLSAPDSVPRFSWGRFFEDHSRILMPLSVQVHHALMDGFHVGKFYISVQEGLDNSEEFLA